MAKRFLSNFQKDILLISGSILVAAIPIWILVVQPRILRLSDDFSYQADLVSFDNFYDQANGHFIGEVQSDSKFSYSVEDVQPALLSINNEFEVVDNSGDQIIHVIRRYGIDPINAQHVPGYGDHDRQGYLFGPRNISSGDSFTYWHVNYDQPVELRYIATEELRDLEVFHYRSTFAVDQTSELGNVLEVGETLGMTTNVVINVWIEPTTGWLVQFEDKGIVYQYDLVSKQRLQPWNSFSNTMTDSSVINQVQQAEQQRFLQVLVQWVLPFVFIMLGLLCLVPYFMGHVRRYDIIVQRAAPIIAGIVGLSITVTLVIFTNTINQQKALLLFRARIGELVEVVDEHVHSYQKALEGGKGVFVSSDGVSEEEWKAYVAGINLQKSYPGLQHMGYAKALPNNENEWQVNVVYLEPSDERLILTPELDMYQEGLWRQALDRSRDTGATTLTGSKSLRSGSADITIDSMLVYLPYYHTDQVFTIEQRRQEIEGYIYGVFNITELLQNIERDELDVPFIIYDTSNDASDTNSVIYQTDDYALSPSNNNDLSIRHLTVFGRNLELHFQRSVKERYLSTFENILPWFIGIGGTVISILTAGILFAAERGYLKIEKARPRHKASHNTKRLTK